MADAVAKAASVPAALVRRAAMLSGDLGRVAVARAHRRRGRPACGRARGGPRRAADARGSAPDVAAALAEVGLASVEWKLDGARIQVHRNDDDVHIYTRNLNEITDRLPGVVEWARALPVRAVVLDGEAIGVDEEERPRAFQDTMSSFGRDVDERGRCRRRARRVLLRRAPRRRRRPRRPSAHRATRGRAGGGGGATHPRHRHRVARRGGRVPRRRDRGRARGRDGEGGRLHLRRRSARRRVAQGQAGADARSRRARGRVGPRAAPGLAVEPAPRRAWSRRHVRDGGQDVQGPHRRAARVADRRSCWRARSAATGSSCTCGPSSSSRSRSTACRRRRRYPGGVALRFARVRRYRDDKSADAVDPIEAVQAMLPG